MSVGGELIAADIEMAAFKWARGNTAIAAVVNNQVHFEVPGKTPPYPLLVISRVGGGPDVSADGIIDDALISFSCWAKKHDKAGSARVASVLITEAFNLFRAPVTVTVDDALVTLHGANPGGALWLPDPETGEARHIVDVMFTTTSVAA